MSSSEQLDQAQSILLATGNHLKVVFSDVSNLQTREGRNSLGDCPFCGKSKHFYISNETGQYICHKCKEAGNMWTYLTHPDRKSLSGPAAAELLIRAAGMVPEQFNEQAYKQKQREQSLMEAAQEYFKNSLWKPEGEPILDYLKSRGLSDNDITAMSGDIGAYPSRSGLLTALKESGYENREARTSGLLLEIKGKGESLGQSHQLTIAWRDQSGRITGYQVRTILPESEQKERGWSKYLNTLGLSKAGALAGFQKARGAKRVVVVESPIDSALLQARGYRAVIATGGSDISEKQLSFLQTTGTEELFLALDQDEAGRAGIEKILRHLPADIKAYVPIWADYKDPGEMVTSQGLDAFQIALDMSQTAPAWMVSRLASKYDLFSDVERDRLLRESLRLRPKYEGLDARDFEERLCSELGVDRVELAGLFARAVNQEKEELVKEKLQETLTKGERLLREGDLTGAEYLFETGLQELKATRGAVPPEPYLLSSLLEDIEKTDEGLFTGFTKLDQFIRFPVGALSYIAAYPGHGKTTLMLNLLARHLNIYPDKKFYFFSYEEAQKFLALKLIMLLSGAVLSDEFNQNAFVNYLKGKRGQNQQIEQAIQQYEEWASSGRLIISDKSLAGEDLAATIAGLPGEQVGAIFVDYIQKVRLRKPHQIRYMEVKEVSNLLLEQAKLQDIPIISGSQMNKEGSLREAEDIFQDASLVLLLQNEAAEQARKIREAGDEPEIDPEVKLEIQTMKQRGGVVGRKASLYFFQTALQINDERKIKTNTHQMTW